jgi:hypothetical protein
VELKEENMTLVGRLAKKKQQEQLNKERDSLFEAKYFELSRLKDSLR